MTIVLRAGHGKGKMSTETRHLFEELQAQGFRRGQIASALNKLSDKKSSTIDFDKVREYLGSGPV